MAKMAKTATRAAAIAAKRGLILAEKIEATDVAAKSVKPTPKLAKAISAKALIGNFGQYQAGTFENLPRVRLKWTEPDLFEFIPRSSQPFVFVRPNGERVTPRNFFTDGGSIPRFVSALNGRLTAWGYAPAYLIHDWEFDRHHCGASKSFNAVRDTLMEALKTLMTTVVPRDEWAFDLVYHGVSSFVAKAAWNNSPPNCPIPPENPE